MMSRTDRHRAMAAVARGGRRQYSASEHGSDSLPANSHMGIDRRQLRCVSIPDQLEPARPRLVPGPALPWSRQVLPIGGLRRPAVDAGRSSAVCHEYVLARRPCGCLAHLSRTGEAIPGYLFYLACG